jgi:hypothetical protein
MTGEVAAVRAELVAAFRAARAADDLPGMTAAALGLTRVQGFGEHPGAAPAYLHEALLAADDPGTRVRLLSGLARSWVYGGEAARAADFADEALALAGSSAEAALLADALDAALLARWSPDDFEERVRLAARLEDVAGHLTDPDARLTAALWRLTTAWECLDVVAVSRQLRALDRLAEETGSPRIAFYAASRRAMQSITIGQVSEAAALVEEVERLGEGLTEADVLAVVHSLRSELHRRVEDTGRLAEEAEGFEAFGRVEGIVSVLAQAALLWVEAGRPDRAVALLDGLPEPASLPADVDLLLTTACVQSAASRCGRDDLAARAAAVLEPYAGRAVLNAGAVTFHGVVDQYVGRTGDALAAYRRIGATWWAERLGQGTAPVPGAPARVHLREADGVWTVGRDGATFTLPDLRGLHHLRTLLTHPGAEVEALDLVGAGSADSDLGAVLDDTAKRAYRARLVELDAEIDEATAWADPARQEKAADERRALLDELAGAVGLLGRDRRPGSSVERARMAVRKAITVAVRRIEAADPAVARLLRDGVRTGTRCRWEPDPGRPVDWVL